MLILAKRDEHFNTVVTDKAYLPLLVEGIS
jgi:hypothetical protein